MFVQTRNQLELPKVADIREDFTNLLRRHEDRESAYDPNEPLYLELTGVSFHADEAFILGEPDIDYITREISWYDSQSRKVEDIPGKTPKIWEQVSDQYGEINSNYGHLVYSDINHSQYTNVLSHLRNDEMSRQAVMVYTRPSIHTDAFELGMQDFICTNTVQYLIRNNELCAVVQMRSNDAVFGYRNDYAWQRVVQTRLLGDLRGMYPELKLGKIIWQVGSLHIYNRHIPLLEQAIAEENWYLSTK